MIEVTLGFIRVCWRWAGGCGNNAEARQLLRAVGIGQHCLKGVMGHNTSIGFGARVYTGNSSSIFTSADSASIMTLVRYQGTMTLVIW